MHDDYIAHYGVKRRSGRYPWGSGDEPFQRGSEGTINGVARNLNNMDLKSASKSLGISNKKMSEAKSNSDYRWVQEAMFSPSFYDSPGRPVIGSGPIPSKDRKPENVSRNLTWDEDKKMWRAAGTVAYWDYNSSSWIVEGDVPYSHIYFNQIWDRWETEDGETVSINSKYESSPGERYRPKGVPENAEWNPHRNCWEVNAPDPPTTRINPETGEDEPVVWDDRTNSWVKAVWNKKEKRWEPANSVVSKPPDYGVPNLPKDDVIFDYKRKNGLLGKLQSTWIKMGSFFKRKISEIIDKFDD